MQRPRLGLAIAARLRRARGIAALALAVLGSNPIAASAAPALSYAVTATIPVGHSPTGVGVDASTHTVFVANHDDATVSRISGDTNAVTKTIGVHSSPIGVAVDPSTHMVYVAAFLSHTLSVVNGVSGTNTANIGAGVAPIGVAVDETTRTVYVTDQQPTSNKVRVIDQASNTDLTPIGVGYRPDGIAVDPISHKVYVSNNDSTVSVIDGGSKMVIKTIDLYPDGQGAGGVAVDETTRTVYVATPGNSKVVVIDGVSDTLTTTIDVGGFPYGIAVDSSVHVVYVANENAVKVIDGETNTIYTTVNAGSTPYAVGVDRLTHTAYVANRGSNNVSVITSPIPPGPGTLTFSHDKYKVTEGDKATITVRRTGDTNVTSSVDYATSDKTALAGTDYTARTGTLHFAPGEKAKTFTVPTIANGDDGSAKLMKLRLSNAVGGSLRRPFKAKLVIDQSVAPQFSAAMPPATATLNQSYRYRFKATGAPAATFSIASGELPPGLELKPNTGKLTGKPTAGGGYAFTVQVSNGTSPDSTSAALAINVHTPPEFTAASPPTTGTVNGFYNYRFFASGDPAPTFALASGTLPPGLTIFANGSFAGTLTAAGEFTFSMKASNGIPPDAVTSDITITVSP